MVRRIFNFFNREIIGLHEAAYLLAGFSFFSQILGLFRDRLLAGVFGAGQLLDVYYASFRIPDFIFVTVSSLVSVTVLIPFILEKIDLGKDEAKKFINHIFSAFCILIILAGVIVFIFTPQLAKIFVPGIAGGNYGGDLITMIRILLLSPILLGISNLFGSITQAYNKFFLYAISPVLYNLGIIIGIIFLYPLFGLTGLVWGVVLGAIFHLSIQIPSLIEKDMIPKFSWKIDFESIKNVVALSLPRTITLGANQLSTIFLIAIASFMISGSISVFNFSYNLQSVPMSIIGVSYSLAAFPTLSRLFIRGDKKKFLEHLISAARHTIFWSIPVIALFVVLRAQIVRTILGSGNFSWNDTRLTAACLAIFAVSVLAQNLMLLFVRGYYSSGQTKKPLLINLISSALIVVLAYVLVQLFNTVPSFKYFMESLLKIEDIPGSVVIMLPLAYSIGTIINAVAHWISFEIDFENFSKDLWRILFQSLASSIIGGFAAYESLGIFVKYFNTNTLLGIFSQGFFAGIVGIIIQIIILYILKNPEIKEIWKTLHQKIWKVDVVVPEQSEL
ncbi:murein biosynthesis integral membrane protein MurJ [Candidatus Nomurabacteria bacterium]|nr:murein biosynthesis integral membrane protein MurJ [Candidatus Nomurabacteria bacterium]